MSDWEQSARERLARADLLTPVGVRSSARHERETLLELAAAMEEIDRLRARVNAMDLELAVERQQGVRRW